MRSRRLPVLLGICALALGGCTQEIPGTPVVTVRVRTAAQQYRTCTDGIATVTGRLDALLDVMDRGPAGAPVDVAAVGRFFEEMRATLNLTCGYWDEQSRPQSAVVVHLAAQVTARSATSRTAITSMIASICGAVESPLDQSGVNLSPPAHEVCAAR